MKNKTTQTGLNRLEVRTVTIGFVLVGIVIAVVAMSYVTYSPFPIRWLVWVIGVAFAAVALLAFEWPRAFRRPPGEAPKGKLRLFLLLAIPLAFVLDSQICGLGLKACTVLCHLISFAVIILAIIIVLSISQNKSVGPLLIPMVILGVVPHCICAAPINNFWQIMLGGYAPTCQVIPLAVTLFSVSALRGVRPRRSAALVVLLLVVILFIVVGNALLGFPWQGCIQ